MNIVTRSADGIKVIELFGRFDAYGAPEVAEWLKEVAASAPARAVVNLGNVTFVDSTALATLVQGMKHCRQQNGDLFLCCLQQPVRIIFELTRLDRAFEIFPDEGAARQAFASGS